MASKARSDFDKNVKDIVRLMELHQQEGGRSRGRRHGLEVLNRSAIVLITSYWEAYCEDIAAEGLAHIVKYAKSADALPKGLKKTIAKELKKATHDLAIWNVADRKWKDYLQSRLKKLQETRNRDLNTPKSYKIDELFESALSITKMSSSWKWAPKITVRRARTKLDKFVALRGSIAHRGKLAKGVRKAQVQDYLNLIKQLAAKTGGKVNAHVLSVTEKLLWPPRHSSKRAKSEPR